MEYFKTNQIARTNTQLKSTTHKIIKSNGGLKTSLSSLFFRFIFNLFALLTLHCPRNSSLGPNSWGGSCGSGSKQSPININTTTAMYDSSLGDFTLVNYGTIPPGVNFTAKNSGKSLKVSMDSHIYNVSGGGLPGVYTTVQLHLHWGSNNSRGSEHTMDGMMYPAEVCYVRC